MIEIKIKTPTTEELTLPLKILRKNIEAIIKDVGMQSHLYMQNYIKNHKVRPGGGTLSKSITSEFFKNPITSGFRIGKVSQLPLYWYVINYGKKLTGERFLPGNGRFVPTGGFNPGESQPSDGKLREGRWVEGFSRYTFKAKRFIPAMNYIENTITFLKNKLKRLRLV